MTRIHLYNDVRQKCHLDIPYIKIFSGKQVTPGHIVCQYSFGPSVQVSRLRVQCSEHHGSLSDPSMLAPCPTLVIYDVPESLFLFIFPPFSQRPSKILSLEFKSAAIFTNWLCCPWSDTSRGQAVLHLPLQNLQAEVGRLLTFIYLLVFHLYSFTFFHGYSRIYIYICKYFSQG